MTEKRIPHDSYNSRFWSPMILRPRRFRADNIDRKGMSMLRFRWLASTALSLLGLTLGFAHVPNFQKTTCSRRNSAPLCLKPSLLFSRQVHAILLIAYGRIPI